MADELTGDYTPPAGSAVGLNFRDRPAPTSIKFKYVLYHPPAGNAVGLDFRGAYTPPAGNALALAFTMDDEGPVVKVEQYLFPKGHDSADFGPSETRHAYRMVSPQGLASAELGGPALRNASQGAAVPGMAPGTVSTGASVWSNRRAVSPTGLAGQLFGQARIWNLHQYALARGLDSQQFGTAFLLGGVRYVQPAGLSAPAPAQPRVVNTTADQFAQPPGIAPLPPGKPAVSPQIVFAAGFGGAVGTPQVQRNPNPPGWASDSYGRPTVRDKTHRVVASADDALALGYAHVFDPRRYLRHSSQLNATTVFGDTQLRLKGRFVRPLGLESTELSPWAVAANCNRYLLAKGIAPGGFGAKFVYNLSPNLTPEGVAAPAVGRHSIGARVRQVRVTGIPAPSAAVGKPSMWQTPALRPKSIVAPDLPAPTVWPRVRAVEGAGKEASLLGSASVWFAYRAVSPPGLNAFSVGDSARLEHGVRGLQGVGFALEQHGTPWVSYRVREVALASGVEAPRWVFTPVVGGLRFIHPNGFDAARFGARVIPQVQALYPLGFAAPLCTPTVQNGLSVLAPRGFASHPQPEDRWGRAKVWNLRQHVAMFYDVDSALNPPAWPQWTAVINRNRTLGCVGADAARVPAPQVTNSAAAVLPGAIAAPHTSAHHLAGSVTHRVRHLSLQGLEPPYMAGWARVANKAVPVSVVGSAQAQYGEPTVGNRNRAVSGAGRIAQTGYGYPFVAPRVRGLSFEGRYAIQPPSIPLPSLGLWTRYVEPPGSALGAGVGLPSLSIHWRIIRPRWIQKDYFGWPTLHNVTPQVLGRGWNAESFGAAGVRLEWRPLPLDGFGATLFGATRIADRRLSVAVPGASYLAVGDKLRVTKEGGRPEQQNIILHELGIEPPPTEKGQVPEPSMNERALLVLQPTAHTRFGTAVVTSNVIRVNYGYHEIHPSDHSVALRIRVVAPEAIDATMTPGKPRLSPHTIYAVTEAPAQAIENHPGTDTHLVDYYVKWYRGASGQYAIGNPRIENHRRATSVSGLTQSSYGAATVANARVVVAPTGFNMMRLGLPAVPGPQDIGPYDNYEGPLWGDPSVARGAHHGPQTIACGGWVAGAFTGPRAALWQQRVLAKGGDSMAMGRVMPGDKPYMWQGLRVGPLVPVMPEGSALDVFGDTAVSLRVRGVGAMGEDSLAMGYTLQEFSKRMRVRYAISDTPQTRRITHAGHQSSCAGTPGLRHGARYIRPDGNSDQHRKGVIQ